MTTKQFAWHPAPSTARRVATTGLRAASLVLGKLARQLGHRGRRGPVRAPVLEFYAEAGAPEGALYVDGHLIGHLPGVTRL
jgi:hypothetical protein